MRELDSGMTAAAGPVSDYLRDLDRRLRGPGRVRRGLLREVRDGLEDATAGLVGRGVDPADAERRAVDEFGRAADIAPEFQRELSVLQARRTAAWVAVAMPSMWVAWDLMWSSAPNLNVAPPVVGVLARLTDVIGIATALLCLAALVVFEVAGRRLRTPERLARAVALTTIVGVSGVMAASVAMTTVSHDETAAVTQASSIHGLIGAMTVVTVTLVLRSALRCRRMADVAAVESLARSEDPLPA